MPNEFVISTESIENVFLKLIIQMVSFPPPGREYKKTCWQFTTWQRVRNISSFPKEVGCSVTQKPSTLSENEGFAEVISGRLRART